MTRRRGARPAFACALTAVALLAAGCAAPAPPAERGINFGFEDLVGGTDWAATDRRLLDAGATAVSLSVGRLDWTAFPWLGHERLGAGAVRDSGADLVAPALAELRTDPNGAPRRVTLTIDALVPGWIAEEPGIAGVNADGSRSASFASVAAWERGPVGERLLEYVAEVAARYRPDAIALTEFLFDGATFSAGDRQSFREHSGRSDWPRGADGAIDTGAAELGDWRSAVLAGVAEAARAEAAAHGVALEVDVRAPAGEPAGDRPENGHDYARLLGAADGIVVWDYFALSGRTPEQSADLAEALMRRDPGRITQSIGLWGEDRTVTPDELRRALNAAARGGAGSVSVTPASRLSDAHWRVIERAWAR